MLSALQITQNRKDPIITARAIHILVRSAEISPKYHQARKKMFASLVLSSNPELTLLDKSVAYTGMQHKHW